MKNTSPVYSKLSELWLFLYFKVKQNIYIIYFLKISGWDETIFWDDIETKKLSRKIHYKTETKKKWMLRPRRDCPRQDGDQT